MKLRKLVFKVYGRYSKHLGFVYLLSRQIIRSTEAELIISQIDSDIVVNNVCNVHCIFLEK